MGKTIAVKIPAAYSRIAFIALLLITMVAATLHIGAESAQAAQAGLSWTAPTTNTNGTPITDLAGYKLHIGNASRSYQQKIDVGKLTNYSVANLTDGSTYYFALTAYNSAGQESAYSTEASKTFPALATTHTITASSGSGGKITALNNTRINTAISGTTTITSVTVTHAASQAFSIAPAAGYAISDVKVDGVSVGKVASYTFSNLTANRTIQATFAAATVTTAGKLVYGANSGGSQFTDAAGGIYSADANFTGGNAGTTSVAISGTTDDIMYQTERWGASSYNIPLPNGNYNLTLKFAETYWSAAGKRLFDVTVGGATVISNLDIFAKAGQNAAYDVVLPVSVTNGTLSIKFVNKVDNAKICAIKVTSASATSSFSISASAGTGGSITPAGSTTLTSGASKSYAIAPAAGYGISDVKVDGVSVGKVASYSFSNVTANHTIQATFAAATVTTAGKLVYAANSGGSQYTDAAGVIYQADAYFTGGNAGTTGVAINGTTDDLLYQAERWGASSYNIPLANGNYNLTLKFAENYWAAAGKRLFDVTVGGVTMISNLDVYAKAGKNTAYDVVLPVSVTNGTLSIKFVNKVDNAKICAVKVVTR